MIGEKRLNPEADVTINGETRLCHKRIPTVLIPPT
jgi:hypothetical protein